MTDMRQLACNMLEMENISKRSKKRKPTFSNVGAFDLRVTTLHGKGGEMNGKNCKQ